MRPMPLFFHHVGDRIRHFLHNEDASTTADWVVLTGGVIGLGLGAVTFVRMGTAAVAQDIQASLIRGNTANLGELQYNPRYVQGEGRGYVQDVPARCDGNNCTAAYTMIQMYYQLDDGTWATMTSIEYEGQAPIVTWTDTQGNRIRAPRFPT